MEMSLFLYLFFKGEYAMKKHISLPLLLLLSLVASNMEAFLKQFHEGEAHWYIMPKIGAAPSIFASHQAHQLMVVPFAGVDPTLCNNVDVRTCNVSNFADILQETPRLPKFGDMFHQGVLHIGFEIGRSICDRSEAFLEFVYNRASGKCYGYCNPFVTLQSFVGCSPSDCNNDCSSSSSSCDDGCPTGTTLSDIASMQDNYENYQAFGGYLGARHFTNRFWCDRFSFWYGYKVGMLHRKAVDACTNIVYNVSAYTECTSDTIESTLNRSIFCKSNTVSGGLQGGFDYCYSDRLSFQFGFEVVASSGLRGNKNFPIDISNITCGATPLTNIAKLPSNIIICNTGAVLNFPVWFGMTWEFGGCFSSCK